MTWIDEFHPLTLLSPTHIIEIKGTIDINGIHVEINENILK